MFPSRFRCVYRGVVVQEENRLLQLVVEETVEESVKGAKTESGRESAKVEERSSTIEKHVGWCAAVQDRSQLIGA